MRDTSDLDRLRIRLVLIKHGSSSFLFPMALRKVTGEFWFLFPLRCCVLFSSPISFRRTITSQSEVHLLVSREHSSVLFLTEGEICVGGLFAVTFISQPFTLTQPPFRV